MIRTTLLLFVFTSSSILAQSQSPSPGDPLSRDAILDVMRRACDYQLDQQAKTKPDNGWIRGAFYTGVMAAHRATGDAKYLDAAMKWSDAAHFAPVTRK